MISSNIRVPEDIWEKIRELATKEERSINSEIVYILKKYIEDNENNK